MRCIGSTALMLLALNEGHPAKPRSAASRTGDAARNALTVGTGHCAMAILQAQVMPRCVGLRY